MSRKAHPAHKPSEKHAEPKAEPKAKPIEVIENPDEPEAPKEEPSKAIPIVSLEEAIEGPKPDGVQFWIGQGQLLEFEDRTTFKVVAAGNHTIHDPKLIANLEKLAVKGNPYSIYKQ